MRLAPVQLRAYCRIGGPLVAEIAAMTSAAPTRLSTPLPAVPRDGGIRHVLVCLDRSALAEASLSHARFVADAFNAKMTLLHVLASPEGEQPPSRPDALEWELTRREAQQYLI